MIKVFEAFAGYGGASFALQKAGIEYETVGFSEIDKNAIKCYQLNHPGVKNFGDITKVKPEDIDDFDMFTGGFPCQAFSIAGKGLGELDPRGTLFYEIIRICEVKKPKWIFLENVAGLTYEPHEKTFQKVLSELDRIGYNIKYRLMNSKYYGTPQSRERIYFVCYRKDLEIESNPFPKSKLLNITVKDILQNDIDEKYYLTDKQLESMKSRERFGDHLFETEVPIVHPTLCSIGKSDVAVILDNSRIRKDEQFIREYENISPTLHSRCSELITEEKSDKRYRRLTPRECFRLQGFFNDEIKLDGLSDSACYKLAGNGWDINTVSQIFDRMFNHKDFNGVKHETYGYIHNTKGWFK